MAYYGGTPPERGTFSDLRYMKYMKCSGRSRGETEGAQASLSQGLDDPTPPTPPTPPPPPALSGGPDPPLKLYVRII